ncbi:MAG: hypothetical protein WC758_08030 [Candidatus Woesearchaeota archaeon]|jgi:hypothetical protein
MPDVSKISEYIRFPFELFGKVLNFVLTYLLEICIVLVAIGIIVLFFKLGIIRRLSEAWIKMSVEDEEERKINKILKEKEGEVEIEGLK